MNNSHYDGDPIGLPLLFVHGGFAGGPGERGHPCPLAGLMKLPGTFQRPGAYPNPALDLAAAVTALPAAHLHQEREYHGRREGSKSTHRMPAKRGNPTQDEATRVAPSLVPDEKPGPCVKQHPRPTAAWRVGV